MKRNQALCALQTTLEAISYGTEQSHMGKRSLMWTEKFHMGQRSFIWDRAVSYGTEQTDVGQSSLMWDRVV